MGETHSGSAYESCYEVSYIREDGLRLLLAGLGQTRWYGLFSGRVREANRILADLYQNGIIDWEEGGVAVRQPYSGLLSAMLEKKTCVTVQIPGTSAMLRCCYLSGTGIVMTQKSQREDDTIGMARLSVQEWIELLSEACTRLEEGECCELSCRSSEDGEVLRVVRILRDGLRAYRIKAEEPRAAGCHCQRCEREELGRRLSELLGLDAVMEKKGEAHK